MISEVKATFEFKRITPDVSFEPENWQLTLKNKCRVYEHIIEHLVNGSDSVVFEISAVLKKKATKYARIRLLYIMHVHGATIIQPPTTHSCISCVLPTATFIGFDSLTLSS